MAKVSFSKLKIKPVDEVKTVIINDVEVEVRQYLPIQEKLDLIGRVIEQAHEQDYNYANPVKQDVFFTLEVVFTYTNLSFTDKQKEDLPKLYDSILSSGILEQILYAIPMKELGTLREGLDRTSNSLYKYQNSIMGVLRAVSENNELTNVNIEKFIEEVKNSKNDLGFLKEVMNNMEG